ncbi:MAG TPA: recombinase family protein [Candidatus Saccharimonadales bacterium]|nr:recombinase family protein [Candidatus Saccharimonadales bacterium]
METKSPELKYCLYARKSSEQDERQAMSIESQTNEMLEMAKREGLEIVETLRESHSAKESGKRPIFNEVLMKIKEGRFNAILTWAPDRLSRNAGDLGSLVDLMDANKLQQIRTYGQSFSNTPNEKFLLMILCSQAKLENDNKSVNVKRGIRAKCEMGIRPGPSPLGYYNRSHNGVKDSMPDPDRAETIKQMFERAAEGWSGRHIKQWLDGIGFTTRRGRPVTLSQIYLMLNNPFYYGDFEFGGKIYKGTHEPLISKGLFEKVREQQVVPQKSKWGSKDFPFRRFLKCASCGSSIVGEEKFKKLKNGTQRRYVYYHCSRQVDHSCKEPFVSEETIVEGLLSLSSTLQIDNNNSESGLTKAINQYSLMVQTEEPLDGYVRYVLERGTDFEKARLIRNLNARFALSDKKLVARPSSDYQGRSEVSVPDMIS